MASDTDFEELLTAATGNAASVRKPRATMVDRLLLAFSLIPALAVVLLMSMAVRVRLADGVWPVTNQPDPKTLGVHNTVTIAAIVASFIIVVLVPIATLAAFALGQRRISIRPVVMSIVGFVVMFAILRLDPGGLGAWIAD